MTLPPVHASGGPEVVETSPETLASPDSRSGSSPQAVQRDHDLGRLYAAVHSAQNRAEMATWPELARRLRGIRAEVWERIHEVRP
jgi:hypothetical protein